jgi:hypothetical protein
MRPNARRPVVRRTKPTWSKTVTPGAGGDDTSSAETPVASGSTPRVSLSKVASLRDDAVARVGASAKRGLDARVEVRQSPRASRASQARSGPSLLDHASANIGHIRTDLARIAILAGVMVAVIVALSFFLA